MQQKLSREQKQEIISHIKHNKFTIIRGDTGCGKNIQILQNLFEEYEKNKNAKILWVLPSNVPIVSLAERVCQEMEMTLGEEIGFELVSESKFGPETRLKFVDDSALVRELINIRKNLNPTDKLKVDYSVIVLDGLHERNLNTDILLPTLKEVALNSDLKLVITSATINEQIFEEYFNTKPIQIEGRQCEVKIVYKPCQENEVQHAANTILDMVKKMTKANNYEYKGHILVFTSGLDDINQIWEIFEDYALSPAYQSLNLKEKFKILPLHGLLDAEEQKNVFEDIRKIKIILATGVAETAITIQGVRVVIDLGYDKETIYDPTMRMDITETRYITQSSAVQRADRAGRTAPGLCMRLYSEEKFKTFSENKVSQIQKMDLGKVVLELKAIGVSDVMSFDFIEKPSQENLIQTIEHLKDLDALDCENGNLTDIGKAMLNLETDPKFSKVIIEGLHRNCEQEVIKIIAMIGVAGSIHCRGWDDANKEEAGRKKLTFCHKTGDLITLLKIFDKTETLSDNEQPSWFKENSLNFNAFKCAKKIKFELEKGLSTVKKTLKIKPQKLDWRFKKSEAFYGSIIKCFLGAFYQNVCHYNGNPRLGYRLLRSNIALKIYGSSSLTLLQENPEYIICLDVNRHKYNHHHTKIVSAIKTEWIQELFSNHKRSTNLSYLSKVYNFEKFFEPQLARSILELFANKKTPEIKEVVKRFQATFDSEFFQERLYVYTPKSNNGELRKKVGGLLQNLRSMFGSETKEINLVHNTRAVLQSGGEIKEILLDNETRSIAFESSDLSWTQNSLLKTFNTITNDDVDSIYVKVDQRRKLLKGTIKMKSSQGAQNLLKYYEKKGLNEFHGGKTQYQPVIWPLHSSLGYGPGRVFRVKIEWYTGVSEKGAILVFKDTFARDWAFSWLTNITQYNDFKRLFTRDALWKTPNRPNIRRAQNPTQIIFNNLNYDVDEDDIRSILELYNIPVSFVSVFRSKELDRTENLTPKAYKDTIREELRTKVGVDSSQILRLEHCAPKEPRHDKRTSKIITDYRRCVEVDVLESAVAKKIIDYFDDNSFKTLTNGKLHCRLAFTFQQEKQEKLSDNKDNIQVTGDSKKEEEKSATIVIENKKSLVPPKSDKKDEIKATGDSKKEEEKSATTVIENKKPLVPPKSDKKDEIQTASDSKKVNEGISKIKQEERSVSTVAENKGPLGPPGSDNKDKIQGTGDSKKEEESASKGIENKKPLKSSASDKQNDETQKTGNDLQEGNMKTTIQVEKLDPKATDDRRIEHAPNVEKDIDRTKRESEPSYKANVEKAANEVINFLEYEINERRCSRCGYEINGGYRLTLCGHKFCYRCFEEDLNYMLQDEFGFPLRCLACAEENKQTKICMRDLGDILRDLGDILRYDMYWFVVQQSLKSYLSRNPESYFRCFSPNCPQIFRNSFEQDFSCDYCLKDYCKKCRRKSHGGQICS